MCKTPGTPLRLGREKLFLRPASQRMPLGPGLENKWGLEKLAFIKERKYNAEHKISMSWDEDVILQHPQYFFSQHNIGSNSEIWYDGMSLDSREKDFWAHKSLSLPDDIPLLTHAL